MPLLQAYTTPTKFLLQFTCLFGIVIFASYEADLTTRMTVKEKPIQLKSFEDIYMHGNKILVRPGNVQYDFLQRAKPGSSLNKIFDSMEPKQLLEAGCGKTCLTDKMEVNIFFTLLLQ